MKCELSYWGSRSAGKGHMRYHDCMRLTHARPCRYEGMMKEGIFHGRSKRKATLGGMLAGIKERHVGPEAR